MSVKPLKIGKKFFQVDNNKRQVVVKAKDTPLYGYEKTNKDGNLEFKDLMNTLINKIDTMAGGSIDIYGQKLTSNNALKPVEVDIKKEIYINKADISKLVSEEIKGKVETKIEKLRRLRKENGS